MLKTATYKNSATPHLVHLPLWLLDNSRIRQLADWTSRGLDHSRTGHLADWSTRGLDNSRTGQVADWTTRGCHRRLCVLSFRSFGGIRDRELSSPRADQSARCPVRELAIRELEYPRVVQLPQLLVPYFVAVATDDYDSVGTKFSAMQ